MTRLVANLKIGHFAAVDQVLAEMQPTRGRPRKIKPATKPKKAQIKRSVTLTDGATITSVPEVSDTS